MDREKVRVDALRVRLDSVMNDPTVSARDKALRADRITNSPLMARDADMKMLPGEGVIAEAIAMSGGDDVHTFPINNDKG
jgi:hypothetical protein